MSGPEVPFPLKSIEDQEIAIRFGFDPKLPFPLPVPHFIDPPVTFKMTRQFGLATYTAHAIAGIVTITASGSAPSMPTTVQLVQLPLMIWPPRFALYFSHPEFVMPVVQPFKVEAALHTQARLDAVTVQDADGLHAVAVENF